MVGTLKLYLMQKNVLDLFSLTSGGNSQFLKKSARIWALALAHITCTRATWSNFHDLNFILYCWFIRVSLFIELGGTGDSGTGEGEPLALL